MKKNVVIEISFLLLDCFFFLLFSLFSFLSSFLFSPLSSSLLLFPPLSSSLLLSLLTKTNTTTGADREGEGEMKIFEHISQLPKGTRCLVVTSDSDLAVFAMNAKSNFDLGFFFFFLFFFFFFCFCFYERLSPLQKKKN